VAWTRVLALRVRIFQKHFLTFLVKRKNGPQFYTNSLNILDKTLKAMQRKKRFQKEAMFEENMIRQKIKENFANRKEGETDTFVAPI
jgi:anaerobic ribonucleoside-triphosphate reductase